jgi:4-diphosphocytidyl-2-C-methyl-D-erythritol kinase
MTASMDTCVIEAPAKINLGLRIVGLRDDGYHLIESVFVPIDWSDEVRLRCRPGPSRRITLTVEPRDVASGITADEIPCGARNLAFRAAEVFLQAADRPDTLEIALTKHLPVGAGLGGGSSDAAAVLRGLAESLPGALAADPLARLAIGLGADVPFFLDPRPAWVGGIGEQVEPLDSIPSLNLLLANPGVPLATPTVFRTWDMLRKDIPDDARGKLRSDLEAWLATPANEPALRIDRLSRLLVNDLEPAALRLCPAIGRLLRRLTDVGALATGMSGSGSTVFGVFESAAAAQTAAEAFDAPAPAWVRVVVTGSAD